MVEYYSPSLEWELGTPTELFVLTCPWVGPKISMPKDFPSQYLPFRSTLKAVGHPIEMEEFGKAIHAFKYGPHDMWGRNTVGG